MKGFVRSYLSCGLLSVVAVYAPTDEPSLKDKTQFYLRLDSVIRRCPKGEVLVGMDDFNAEIGRETVGY